MPFVIPGSLRLPAIGHSKLPACRKSTRATKAAAAGDAQAHAGIVHWQSDDERAKLKKIPWLWETQGKARQ
jgi:hypothetical protein